MSNKKIQKKNKAETEGLDWAFALIVILLSMIITMSITIGYTKKAVTINQDTQEKIFYNSQQNFIQNTPITVYSQENAATIQALLRMEKNFYKKGTDTELSYLNKQMTLQEMIYLWSQEKDSRKKYDTGGAIRMIILDKIIKNSKSINDCIYFKIEDSSTSQIIMYYSTNGINPNFDKDSNSAISLNVPQKSAQLSMIFPDRIIKFYLYHSEDAC